MKKNQENWKQDLPEFREKTAAFYQELQGLSVHAQVNEAGEVTAAE